MKTISVFTVSACVLLLSCGGEDTPPTEPTLSSIQSTIFNTSCALASCHSVATAEGNLILTAGMSRDELINVLADNDAAAGDGKLLVVPGDPDESFLIQKLEGPGADEGDMMPQEGSSLPQARIDAIREWISDGALDN